MKNEKGFTLVEILSVLLILGIIGVIVYPQVNKVIDKNREKVLKEDIKGLVKSLDIYLASDDYKKESITFNIETSNESFIKNSNWKSGNLSYDGTIIAFDDIYNGEYCVNGNEKDYTFTKGEC